MLILHILKIFFFNVAEINRQRWLEESGQCKWASVFAYFCNAITDQDPILQESFQRKFRQHWNLRIQIGSKLSFSFNELIGTLQFQKIITFAKN